MTTKYLKVINQYGGVQLTDEASAYYFLLMKIKLGAIYISTSANCKCTWDDGTVTNEAYNYCLLNNSNNICVIKNPSDKQVRMAVAPINFTGDASFNICCTGCEKEIADNLDVYIFAPSSSFRGGKVGMQLYNANGELIYDASWKPLKITNQAQSIEALENEISLDENQGVLLNSGYRQASDTNYVIGTFLIDSDVQTWQSYPVMGEFTSGGSLDMWIAGGQLKQELKNNTYYGTGPINTFPDNITYQGFVLSKGYVYAQKYSAWSPRATKNYEQKESVTKPVLVEVKYQEWDDCATKSYVWDDCARKDFEFNSATGKMEWVCKSGLLEKCQAGFVTKTKQEWQNVTTTITYQYLDVYPTLDRPSLMYGMEIYPDGTLFTRTSGLSTLGIVDLKNY